MQTEQAHAAVTAAREFFDSGITLDYSYRRRCLDALYEAVSSSIKTIHAELREDLGKSEGEAYLTETGIVLSEIAHARKHLRFWMKPRKVPTPLSMFPSGSRVYPEPFGVALVISPWNYPFFLSMAPVVNAAAAGNCVVLKPSSRAPATARELERILTAAFEPGHVRVLQGGADLGDALLAERFDFILYTGSTRVGRKVMEAAAERLVPVCLELGGKSPVIVCEDADLALAARRIAWGKTVNAGQTCVAPDYVLVQHGVKERLLMLLEENFQRFPGPDPVNNTEYARIVSPKALERLAALSGGRAVYSADTMRMAPLLMPGIEADAPVMREEIFGPLLPVLGYADLDEALAFVRERPKPLACYVFSRSEKSVETVLRRLSFGGGCVNDVLLQAGSHFLPFGGVGPSGMGRYHGKAGFELFSNMKGIVRGGTFVDPPLRYPPYTEKGLSFLRRFLR